MKTVSAREADQAFSQLLGEAEAGEEIVITKRGRPVAVLSPYRAPVMTAERSAAVKNILGLMRQGVPLQISIGRPDRIERPVRSWLAAVAGMKQSASFKGRHFEAEVILWALRWYLLFAVSYRDLELMLQDRGVSVDHTTIYRWVQAYAPTLEKRLRPRWKSACGRTCA